MCNKITHKSLLITSYHYLTELSLMTDKKLFYFYKDQIIMNILQG